MLLGVEVSARRSKNYIYCTVWKGEKDVRW